MRWLDKIREWFGFEPSHRELARRWALIQSGETWPPAPKPCPKPPLFHHD